jgi:hypothetical protein
MNIAPDVNCPHCGWVIICPHTPAVPYPPNCINTNTAPPPPDVEWTDDFLENMRRIKAWEAAAIRDEVGKTPPARSDVTPSVRPTAIAQPGRNPAYVAAAIRGELGELANAREGTRNDTLNRVAFRIFAFVKAGHADEKAARAEMTRIAAANGLPHSEIQSTLRSAWNSASPCDVPAPSGGSA